MHHLYRLASVIVHFTRSVHNQARGGREESDREGEEEGAGEGTERGRGEGAVFPTSRNSKAIKGSSVEFIVADTLLYAF